MFLIEWRLRRDLIIKKQKVLNQQETCAQHGAPQRLHVLIPYKKNKIFFFNWLAGLIDGDGSLLVNKNGYATIEITLHERDVQTLYKIKDLLQGKVNSRVKTKAYVEE